MNGVAILTSQVAFFIVFDFLFVLWIILILWNTKNSNGTVQFKLGKTGAKVAFDGAIRFFNVVVTIVVVVVPKGLLLVVTLTFGHSMKKQRPSPPSTFETVGSATTIWNDKTITLTLNHMTIMDVYVGVQLESIAHIHWTDVVELIVATCTS